MEIVICAIAKNENLYINDWVNWHINLGFDKIYLYDNNNLDTEYIGNFIEQKDKVKIIDVRGISNRNIQIESYNNFYNTYKFDWCAFIDIDEFIVFNKWKNVQEFVTDPIFKNTNVIKLNWHLFGDDNKINRDLTIPIYKSITKRLIGHKDEMMGKQFLRGGLKNIYINSCHYCKINGKVPKQLMVNGKETTAWGNGFKEDTGLENHEEAYINHYRTKTLSEFINQKMGRGWACHPGRLMELSYFWNINEKTPEKLEYLKKLGFEK